jgi:hypothetical protein
VLRPISSALAFAAAASLAAGCASSHTATNTSATSAGNSTSTARVTAYAHEVNLSAADVPGAAVGSPEREGREPTQAGVEFARCIGGVSPKRRVANIKSATFRIGAASESIQVKSSVEVMPTDVLAAQNYAAAQSARGRACIVHRLPHMLEGRTRGRAHFGQATVSFLPDLLSAGKESFGVRVTTTLNGRSIRGTQIRLPVYLDVFAFRAGPAEISLSAAGISRAAPTTTERRLLSLLYTRAETRKLP